MEFPAVHPAGGGEGQGDRQAEGAAARDVHAGEAAAGGSDRGTGEPRRSGLAHAGTSETTAVKMHSPRSSVSIRPPSAVQPIPGRPDPTRPDLKNQPNEDAPPRTVPAAAHLADPFARHSPLPASAASPSASLAPPRRPRAPTRTSPTPTPTRRSSARRSRSPTGSRSTCSPPTRMIEKPIEMNFDAAGRLWVATSETYPQVKPGQVPNDKVIVLEDTTGAGKADKSTVFADGLLIPTGIAPGDGGVYVTNSTEIDFLKDTDRRSGKADYRRVVLAGFGTEDTHHIVHAFRWGPDGRLYFNQSIYIHSTLETPHGTKRLSAAASGGSSRRRWTWTCSSPAWSTAGATSGTAGATPSAPTAPAAKGSTTSSPAPPSPPRPDAKRVLPGLNPGSPKYCQRRSPQRPADARRRAGRHAHQRLPGQPRRAVQAERQRGGLRRQARCRTSSPAPTRRSGRWT